MALIPKLSVCALDSCSTLRIKEITGVYDALNNLYGWNTPNITVADLTSAELIITSPSGTVTTVDVLSQLPDPYVEDFYFTDISIIPEDGEWSIQYKVITTTGPVTYSNILKTFLTCSVRCCIDKIWSKVLNNYTDCGCGCTDISELEQKASFMESLYDTMISAAACNNSDTRDKILTQLQRLCKLEKCNC
jgi:hypothetical protein